MKINVIGFCRFSFFGQSDTKLSYDDKKAAFDTLYDEQRMRTRFLLFETLLLPSVVAQKNKDFILHVMTSEVMPRQYRERLRRLCAPHENIALHFFKSENLKREMAPLLKAASNEADRVVQFRIDDDDALSVNYIDRLFHWGAMLSEPTIVTMPNGLMSFDNGKVTKCQPFRRYMTAVGFAFVTPGRPTKNVFQFSHIKAAKRYTVLSDPSIFSHIQTFTSTADTRRRADIRIKQFSQQYSKRYTPEQIENLANRSIDKDFPYVSLEKIHALQAEVNIPKPVVTLPKTISKKAVKQNAITAA